MRLKRVSTTFFGGVLLALGLNLLLLLLVRQAGDVAVQAVARRDIAMGQVDQLLHESDLLSHLVQSYTTTARVQYLSIYYDILAVRQGEKAAPAVDDLPAYWRGVMSGRQTPLPVPAGQGLPLLERLRQHDFSPAELDQVRQMLAVTRPMQEIEKTAFAATQGLYDRQTQAFVSEGQADRALAIELVHAPHYESLRAELDEAVKRVSAAVEQRTQADVSAARARLQQAIAATLGVNLLLLPLFLVAFRVIQGRVLRPIALLEALAGGYTRGNFTGRSSAQVSARAPVDELSTLAQALDAMASAIQTDLRERDRVQHDLQVARDQAQAAAQAKGMFLANMSHEIRTPMNAIMGMTQLALRTELTAQQRDYLDKAFGASTLLLGLINDVLDFSKIEAGGMQLEDTTFELESVLSQSIGLVRQRAQDKDLELLCEVLDPTLLVGHGQLLGDPLRLSQILINLLGNAVKFTPAGQVALRVDTEPLPADQAAAGAPGPQRGLVFSVSDTGIGMTPGQRDALFKEFAQADVSTTRRFGGTGLGLAISKRLVDLMGGRIDVQSQLGAGTLCTLHLPLRTPPAVTNPAATDPLAAPSTDQGKLRVLVVDDQRDTLAAVQGLLQRLGVGHRGRIASADSGHTALEQLSAARAAGQPFDLVLLDWVLPDMDGGEVMRLARRAQADLRIAVMTAYGSDHVLAQASAAGSLAQITKPVLPEDLRKLLQRNPNTTTAVTADNNPRLDGLRVLLVEDNALNRQLAIELLQERGARVCSAEHGLEAVERLEADGAGAHDVVLMDLQMPVMDGYEAVRRLRLLPALKALPILAMTANAMAGERARCLALGMQGHITKPLDPALLFRTLAALLPAAPHTPGVTPASASTPLSTPATSLALPTAAAPSPPTPHSAASAPAWPAVPGLDTARLLAHCDGNAALARQLLAGFERDYADGVAAWSGWVDKAAWADLQRAAHTLQGLAGTLGAAGLQADAAHLERLAETAETSDGAACRNQLACVDQTLASLLNGLAAARPGLAAAAQAPSRSAGIAPTPADLSELVALLDQSDSRAMAWWQDHEPALATQLPPVLLRRLGNAMARYDFDAALQAIAADQARRDSANTPHAAPTPELEALAK